MLHTGSPRRAFLRWCALAGAAALSGALSIERALAAVPGALLPGSGDPEHPEIPNQQVARILKAIAGDQPIRRGHVALDMPVVAEDGRVVPVMIESDLPMTADEYVRGVHLIVDHNPDPHLAAFHLTPALGRASITTRIKMKRTTWVRAIAVTSKGQVWAGYAHVKVTLNGCG